VQLGGIATVLSLGSFMFVMFRRDIKHDLEVDDDDNDRRNG